MFLLIATTKFKEFVKVITLFEFIRKTNSLVSIIKQIVN